MSNLSEKFGENSLSRQSMRAIKGGDGIQVFSKSSSYSTTIYDLDNYGYIMDSLVDGDAGADGNFYSNNGWCCQNLTGIVWVYRTTEAMASAISGGTGPTGDDIQCTMGTYCP